MKRTVGFIGLGNMGMGMAGNLLKAGFPLLVYDVRPEPMVELVQMGARAAGSPRDLGAQAETVVVMVLSFLQMQQAILGPDGAAGAMVPGSTVIGCSTISPSQARDLAAALAERRISYIDAPVSGGKARAAGGSLTVMAGADSDVFAAHRPVLEAMSANLHHCGPVGTGQTAKMCNQLMAGVSLVATAECMALGAAAGMDLKLLQEIITQGTGDGWMFRNRADRMIAGDFRTRARLDIFAKDLGIVLEAADGLHLPLLLASAARQWVMMGVAEGHGAEDDSAVVKVMEKLTGVSVRAE